MTSELYVGRVRSVVLITLLSVLTLGIYFLVWFYQLNKDLQRHLGSGVSPAGRLLLLIFVPVIGWFIAILLTGRSVRRAQLNANTESLIVPTYHAVWATLVPYLGFLIAAGYLQRGANRAWLKINNAFETATRSHVTIECPDCDTRFATFFNSLLARPVACPQCGRTGDV